MSGTLWDPPVTRGAPKITPRFRAAVKAAPHITDTHAAAVAVAARLAHELDHMPATDRAFPAVVARFGDALAALGLTPTRTAAPAAPAAPAPSGLEADARNIRASVYGPGV